MRPLVIILAVVLASDTGSHNEASLRAHERCGFEEVKWLIKVRESL